MSDVIKALERAKELIERHERIDQAAILPPGAYHRLGADIEKMSAMKAHSASVASVFGIEIHALPGLPEDSAYMFKDKKDVSLFMETFSRAIELGMSPAVAAQLAKISVEYKTDLSLKGIDFEK